MTTSLENRLLFFCLPHSIHTQQTHQRQKKKKKGKGVRNGKGEWENGKWEGRESFMIVV